MKIRCLLVDDEPLALSVLEKYISQVVDMEIVASCESALEAFQVLQKHQVDLIFLDIQMPELTGLQFLRSLEKAPKVILTTAYREYAFDGFDLDVLDYLLKPISFERFLKAITKYYRIISPEALLKEKIVSAHVDSDQFILVKEKKSKIKVPFKDILYIESIKDYVKIVMTHRTVVTKMFISEIEQVLPDESFLRIHRSFIVPVNKIDSYSANQVEIGEQEIPIGRSYKNLVVKRLDSTTSSN